jgi:hypothetical protein
MTPPRPAALEGVPCWAWKLDLEAAWEEKLTALRAHVGVRGRLPPQRGASGLGEWVHHQRQAKTAMEAEGKSDKMTPARAAALEAVPSWSRALEMGSRRRRAPSPERPPAPPSRRRR